MSDSDDYLGDMRLRVDHDIERLLAGSLEPGDGLGPVAALFDTLRAEAGPGLDEETIARFVHAAAEASSTPAAVAAVPGAKRAAGRSLLVSTRRRVAAVTAAATMFLGSMSGLAVAADGAKPGDALYGIDRALEAVGIGDGEAAERLVEVQALVDDGEVHRGLRHAAESLDKQVLDDSAASAALSEAAARVQAGGADQSAATREKVAGLLTYISENVHDLDGRQVAELAREIGGPGNRPKTPPDVPGQSDSEVSTPPGLSDRTPGPPDHAPADPPGRSDSAPKPPKPPKSRSNRP